MCQKVAAQKKANTRVGVEGKKAKSQNLLHQLEENSLANSVKVLD